MAIEQEERSVDIDNYDYDLGEMIGLVTYFSDLIFIEDESFIQLLKVFGKGDVEKLTEAYFGEDGVRVTYMDKEGKEIVGLLDYDVFKKWLKAIGEV